MTVTTSPTGLDAVQRTQLERLVTRARAGFEADLGAQAEGRFGIHADGTIEEEQALPDDASDRATRRDLVEIIDHICSLGESQPDAVARLLREATFTHLNQLLAIRIAEAIGLLPESLANGRQSRGFKDLGEIMPILGDDYWGYLLLCGDELAADAPALFDPRNPLLALVPSTSALDEIVALLGEPNAAQLWLAPDTLGWAYQFFNTADERRLMREGATAPRTSRELAVRNQFFTPRYVVDFLVQNTLGRRLIENDPTSPLLSELPLLVDPPTAPGPPLDLDDTSVLDPACGSGHFLLGCYDLLERAWELQGVPPSESAPAIVASLWGVDIDPRCAQVASAAVVLRARRHCRDLPLPRPNIITARSLPAVSPALTTDPGLGPEQHRLLESISEVLADAPLLGTLLKAEDALEREIRHAAFGGAAGTLPLTEDAFSQVETDLMAHLQAVADQASSSVAERLFAAEADDALRLVEVVRKRYDAVLMNPPFGEPVPETKPYLRATYPWIPTRDYNLLAAFVGRGLELCKPDGYLGAITSRAGMFLSTFEQWRRRILLHSRLQAVADLGLGVMQQALVEAAAYAVGRGETTADHEATFIRLLKDSDREAGLASAIQNDRAGAPDHRVHRVRLSDLDAIPGAPIAYWMSPSLRALFSDLPSVEGTDVEARVGLQTGDDFRFVRTFWEVDPGRIARSASELNDGCRWAPFAKGGEYSPYWADIHLVVDWEGDGQRVRLDTGSRPQNTQYFFRPGLTWPARTASGFGPRILPPGCIFGHKGPAVLLTESGALLAWLTSRLAAALMAASQPAGDETSSGTASKSYEVGLVQKLPWPGPVVDERSLDTVAQYSVDIAERRRREDALDETTRLFVAPPIPLASRSITDMAFDRWTAWFRAAVSCIADSAAAERCFSEALHLDADAMAYLDAEIGPHPDTYPDDPLDDETAFARWFELPMDQLIDEVITTRGATRSVATMTFVADRRLEVLAHGFARHPSVVCEARERLGLLTPEEPAQTADDLLSYLVGIAFGRWDIRIGRNPALAPAPPELFDPVPLCPPGMLVGADGFPSVDVPPGYPLELPVSGLLVDEPGHRWDVEDAVLRAARILLDDPDDIVAEMLGIFGRRMLRDHVRRQFFKDHLSRYSKSRRKAPIYWPLSVPSKSWGVWLYAPTLARETLYAVASETARRERLATEAIARLQREQQEGGVGRPARKIAEELDFEEKLTEELRRFRTEAERIAGLGWEPSLDDGLVLCAAPLADLFPAWADARKARDELRRGQYEWASVAQWAEEL
jgi:tRNA1(Val) A37 N6-methylase TrmN6